MARPHAILIGASSGRVTALLELAAQLPADVNAAIFEGKETMENLSSLGTLSTLNCPDCGGGLWE